MTFSDVEATVATAAREQQWHSRGGNFVLEVGTRGARMEAIPVSINVSGEDIVIYVSQEELDRAMADPDYARELALIRRPGGQAPVAANVGEANAVWERASVLALLEELRARKDDQAKKKDAFVEVASALAALGHHYSVQQVRSKVDALKRRYKYIKDHKAKSGNGAPPQWEFFETMDDIFGGQAWVAPRSTACSSDGPSTSQATAESGSSLTKKRKRPEEMIEGIYKKLKNDREEMREEMRVREEEKERKKQARHEEKMELRRQFLALMERATRGGDDVNKN